MCAGLLLLLWLGCGPTIGAPQPATLALPPQAQALLYAKFSDWRFVSVPEQVRQGLQQEYGADVNPALISGDFDGDGRADYAAFVEQGAASRAGGASGSAPVCLAVFLQQQAGFKLYVLDDVNADYIQLIHKGDGGYDFETQKKFVYQHDAIDAVIFEKAATSYVYEQGRFRAIISGD
jgi:hypothetical protein